ncbi:MAG TPA: hypothetical protein VLU46_15135 [Thermoanaerobaculia bacterium]|nr:hypothetical protein [Thermoanaerobaculia bacterium]
MTLLFALLLNTLVLKSGDRIAIDGPVQKSNGVIVFRVVDGGLYSIPESEVDAEATRAANQNGGTEPQALPKKLKVSNQERDRLIRELEQNHSGTPPRPLRAETEAQASSREESQASADKSADEARWRTAARAKENAVAEAKENVARLRERADQLRAEIRTLLGMGQSPDNFSNLTMQLGDVESQISYAEAAVDRAQRDYDDFKEDARRQGILPGWLR